MSATKIHWSTQTFPEFACEKKRRRYRRTDGRHNSRVSAAEFVAKHAECPNVFCTKCALIAEAQSRVTFSAAEVEHLRGLVKYLARGWVGGNGAEGLRVLREKVGRD